MNKDKGEDESNLDEYFKKACSLLNDNDEEIEADKIETEEKSNLDEHKTKAIQILEKLASLNYEKAILRLSAVYKDAEDDDNTPSIKLTTLIEYLNNAISNGSFEACYELGSLYQHGKIGSDKAKNIILSKNSFEKGMKLGSYICAFSLYELYRDERQIWKANEYFDTGIFLKEMSKFSSPDQVPTYTENDMKDKPWLIISNKVYDFSSYIHRHPGGSAILLENQGKDASEEFFTIHSSKAKKLLAELFIGFYSESVN